MDGWLVTAIVVVGSIVLLAAMQRFGLIDLTDKRRGGGGGGAGAFVGLGDVFFPTRAEAAQELVQQRERTHEAPSPGDGDLGIYDGTLAISIERSADDAADRGVPPR